MISWLKQNSPSAIAALFVLGTIQIPTEARQPVRSFQTGWNDGLLIAQSYYWEPDGYSDEQEASYIYEEINRDFDGYLDAAWYIEDLRVEIIEALSDAAYQDDADDVASDANDVVGEIPDEVENAAFNEAVQQYYYYGSASSTSGPIAQLSSHLRRLPLGGRLKPSSQTVPGRRIAQLTSNNIARRWPY
jgi:hypothetical protein